jgi:spore coat polysaccharide biosynthesis protein SpsF
MPGKTMAKLAGRPSLRHIIDRLRLVDYLAGIVIATSTDPEDVAIQECAREAGAEAYRGSTDDVLGRTLAAASYVGATTVVFITGDCPLIDPSIVANVVAQFRHERPDFATNALHGYTYPMGLDVEVFPRALLEVIESRARTPREREHVTLYFYEHPETFSLLGIEPADRHHRPELRLTLDTPADYALISRLYTALYHLDPQFGLDAVLDYLERHPDLIALNRHIEQKVP